ncbi:MAG: hypothetical protein ISS33_02870 [Candidatus Omnitrophica bacterium]|nr:hypothetical protein [Candidatus Omnitrophota bacterium]
MEGSVLSEWKWNEGVGMEVQGGNGWGPSPFGLRMTRGGVKRENLFLMNIELAERGGEMKKGLCALFTVIYLLSSVPSFGLGMEVDPVDVIVTNCPLGEKVTASDLGGDEMILRIQNKDPGSHTYTVNVLSAVTGNGRLKPGFQDIPDTSWVTPETKEISIQGNSTGKMELYINVPNMEKYGDKKYQGVIEVKSKKDAPGDMFVLAVQIGLRISTLPAEPNLEIDVTREE